MTFLRLTISPTTLLLTLPLLSLLLLTLRRYHRMYNNYRLLRLTNPTLPVLLVPITWQDPLWLFLSPYLLFLRHLPLLHWINYSHMGWTCDDKARIHRPMTQGGMGEAFAIVSPGRTEFFTIDPKVGVATSRRWREFERPGDLYEVFNVLGKNVISSNGGEWKRHRKVVGGAFREGVYAEVWRETGRLGKRLVGRWLDREGKGRLGLGRLRTECEVLAMGVLSKASFGTGTDGAEGLGLEKVERGHTLSYMECLRVMMPNLMGVILVGGLKMPFPEWFFPKGLRKVKLAVNEYRIYLAEAVQREQKKGMAEQSGVPNLATLMVRANDIEKDQNLASGTMTGHLSDDELYGNMFAFNMAGFETTAMTLSFCLPHLALYPDVQEWAREEVDAVFREGGELSYEQTYERLPRVRALMHETLRLHSPVAHLPRQSPPETTTLDVPSLNMTLTIPPTSLVATPIGTVGYMPNEFNGPDPYVFNPRRFIATDKTGLETVRDDNELLEFGYMPFTTGPRSCPGKKFSQVEFVRLVSEVLLDAEIRPAQQQAAPGASPREKLKQAVRDTYFNLTLHIRNPDLYAVEIVARTRR